MGKGWERKKGERRRGEVMTPLFLSSFPLFPSPDGVLGSGDPKTPSGEGKREKKQKGKGGGWLRTASTDADRPPPQL